MSNQEEKCEVMLRKKRLEGWEERLGGVKHVARGVEWGGGVVYTGSEGSL